jgi:hypothetical protein
MILSDKITNTMQLTKRFDLNYKIIGKDKKMLFYSISFLNGLIASNAIKAAHVKPNQ